LLEAAGSFNDEDSKLGSMIVEHHLNMVERRLREVG